MTIMRAADLKAELARRELTQRRVASQMGVTHGYLSKLINGTGGVEWNRRLALAFSAVTSIPVQSFYVEREEVTA